MSHNLPKLYLELVQILPGDREVASVTRHQGSFTDAKA